MDKYEYAVRYYNGSVIKISFLSWLDERGQEGWELVRADKDGYNCYDCIFKRKKENGKEMYSDRTS